VCSIRINGRSLLSSTSISFCLGQYISYAHAFPLLYSILQQFTKWLKNKTHCTKVSTTHDSLRFERFACFLNYAHTHIHTHKHTQKHTHTHTTYAQRTIHTTHTHTKKHIHTTHTLSELTRSKASSKYMFTWYGGRHRKECDVIEASGKNDLWFSDVIKLIRLFEYNV